MTGPVTSPRYDLPPLARLETNWAPPWLISRLIQHGPHHYERGQPMDDSHVIGSTSGAVWMAVADGVGSEPRSRFGSAAACAGLEAHLARKFSEGAQPTRTMMVDAFDAAIAAIAQRADLEKQPSLTYATTLAAVVIKDDILIGGCLGDSSLLVLTQHQDETGAPAFRITPLCSAPQPPTGSYALPNPQWRSLIATSEVNASHVVGVILATDGANNFFIDNDTGAFNAVWCEHIEDQIKTLQPRTYVNFAAHFINLMPPENSDDRTLLIAYRAPADCAPPAPKSK